MYCPECGKELVGEAWRCGNCGSNLRRILKEEYLSKQESKEAAEPKDERFQLPEDSISDIGWRRIHKDRRPAVVWMIIDVSFFIRIKHVWQVFEVHNDFFYPRNSVKSIGEKIQKSEIRGQKQEREIRN